MTVLNDAPTLADRVQLGSRWANTKLEIHWDIIDNIQYVKPPQRSTVCSIELKIQEKDLLFRIFVWIFNEFFQWILLK